MIYCVYLGKLSISVVRKHGKGLFGPSIDLRKRVIQSYLSVLNKTF